MSSFNKVCFLTSYLLPYNRFITMLLLCLPNDCFRRIFSTNTLQFSYKFWHSILFFYITSRFSTHLVERIKSFQVHKNKIFSCGPKVILYITDSHFRRNFFSFPGYTDRSAFNLNTCYSRWPPSTHIVNILIWTFLPNLKLLQSNHHIEKLFWSKFY
jgi:hypothetical protein